MEADAVEGDECSAEFDGDAHGAAPWLVSSSPTRT